MGVPPSHLYAFFGDFPKNQPTSELGGTPDSYYGTPLKSSLDLHRIFLGFPLEAHLRAQCGSRYEDHLPAGSVGVGDPGQRSTGAGETPVENMLCLLLAGEMVLETQ